MSTLNATNLKNPSSVSNNIVLGTDGSTTIPTLSATTITGTSVRGGITSGTVVPSTSGTSIDFTSIPSWVKRVTVMFDGVSTDGTDFLQVQIGSGSLTTSGYNSTGTSAASSVGTSSATSGFVVRASDVNSLISGQMVLTLVSVNNWASSHMLKVTAAEVAFGAGDVTLSGVLDQVRITTVGGTNTFDAGTINLLLEG